VSKELKSGTAQAQAQAEAQTRAQAQDIARWLGLSLCSFFPVHCVRTHVDMVRFPSVQIVPYAIHAVA